METQLFAKESACAAIVETGHALIEKNSLQAPGATLAAALMRRILLLHPPATVMKR
jgi:hypothetical protein